MKKIQTVPSLKPEGFSGKATTKVLSLFKDKKLSPSQADDFTKRAFEAIYNQMPYMWWNDYRQGDRRTTEKAKKDLIALAKAASKLYGGAGEKGSVRLTAIRLLSKSWGESSYSKIQMDDDFCWEELFRAIERSAAHAAAHKVPRGKRPIASVSIVMWKEVGTAFKEVTGRRPTPTTGALFESLTRMIAKDIGIDPPSRKMLTLSVQDL